MNGTRDRRGHPAVFLDKDGTLVENIPFNACVNRIRFMPKVPEALAQFSKMDFMLIIITNQPGISLGLISEDQLLAVREHLNSLFRKCDALLKGFYYCPHGKGDHRLICRCRKPHSFLFHKAAKEFDIDLSRSWMIGDILDDVEAGHRAGCRSILINNGNETEWLMTPQRLPEYVAAHLQEAAQIISIEDGI